MPARALLGAAILAALITYMAAYNKPVGKFAGAVLVVLLIVGGIALS